MRRRYAYPLAALLIFAAVLFGLLLGALIADHMEVYVS